MNENAPALGGLAASDPDVIMVAELVWGPSKGLLYLCASERRKQNRAGTVWGCSGGGVGGSLIRPPWVVLPYEMQLQWGLQLSDSLSSSLSFGDSWSKVLTRIPPCLSPCIPPATCLLLRPPPGPSRSSGLLSPTSWGPAHPALYPWAAWGLHWAWSPSPGTACCFQAGLDPLLEWPAHPLGHGRKGGPQGPRG